jgi:hypothetical protein
VERDAEARGERAERWLGKPPLALLKEHELADDPLHGRDRSIRSRPGKGLPPGTLANAFFER